MRLPRPRLPLSLRWRLTALIAGFVGLTLVVVGVAQYVLLERYLLARTSLILRTEASPLIESASQVETPREAAQQIVAGLASRNVAVAVVGPSGVRLAAAGGPPPRPPRDRPPPPAHEPAPPPPHDPEARPMARPDWRRWLVGRLNGDLVVNSPGQRRLVVTIPARLGRDGSPALVLLSTPLSSVDSTLRWILVADGVGMAMLLGLFTIGTWLIVGRALRPMNRLVEVAGRIGDGDLGARSQLAYAAEDEVGRLARAFDTMGARLERLFASQRQFVADASHELKTPLTTLRGSLDMLLLGMSQSPEETNRLLRAMHRQTTRMSRLVQDLLELTRMDSGMRLQPQPVDLVQVAHDVEAEIEPVLQRHTLRVEAPPDGETVWAMGDPDRVHQVLLGLVDNAIRHTPGGQVVVRVSARDGQASLAVEDSGPGIPAEDLPRLFERFYRGDASRARCEPGREGGDLGGFGLGLPIARALARALHGDLEAASRPGHGSTFTLRLPKGDG